MGSGALSELLGAPLDAGRIGETGTTRYLVTTALEESWPEDQPIAFLTEGCRRFDRRDRWARLDAPVLPPFGVAAADRESNRRAVRGTAAGLLPELAAALDRVHGTRHSVRYWEILLGHWLIRCVAAVFNRYGALALAARSGLVQRTVVLAAPDYRLATADSETFKWACNDDLWNHVLFGKLLASVHGIASELRPGRLDGVRGFGARAEDAAWQPTDRKAQIASLVSEILPRLARRSDAVLVSTYLPLDVRLRLELSMGQVPQVWRSPRIAPFSPSDDLRQELRLEAPGCDGFARIVRTLVPELVPTCYLEGYADLSDRASRLRRPAAPRFIYAANNWDTDELFKAWTAMHVERGVPYVTGQHGNNYGTHVWSGAAMWPERSAADRFLTWGWSDGSSRTVPAFNFRTARRRAPRLDPRGGLLLVEQTLPHRVEPHDVFAEFAGYQEAQFRFVAALPTTIRRGLTVRLYGEYRRHPWRDEERWRARCPDVVLETGLAPITSLLEQSRLVVHSYDSTGILEGLALDTPLICFWQNGLEHLLPSARPFYELLRDAGILYDTPEAAARAVAEYWADVGGWWSTAAVQGARAAFTAQYSRQVSDPVAVLRNALLHTSASAA